MARLRANGSRLTTMRERKIIERLWVGGHSDKQIGEMVGRTTRGVRGIRSTLGLTEQGVNSRANNWFSTAEDAQIDKLIQGWVEIERLSCKEMSNRLKRLHPPGLHLSTIRKRIRSMCKQLSGLHNQNMQGRKARRAERMHKNGGVRTQPRHANGKFVKREVQHEPGRDSATAQRAR